MEVLLTKKEAAALLSMMKQSLIDVENIFKSKSLKLEDIPNKMGYRAVNKLVKALEEDV